MRSDNELKAKLYTRYPMSSVLIYNGSTILHFLLGGIGIGLSYPFWVGYIFGPFYFVFAFVEMYVVMPLIVCPNCVYSQMEGSLCVSGLNVFSRKASREGDPKNFARRAEGLFCPNNLYLASLVIPLLAMIPEMIVNFSVLLLILFILLMGLLLFRFFVIFPKIACLHCRAKYGCPQAEKMGVRNR